MKALFFLIMTFLTLLIVFSSVSLVNSQSNTISLFGSAVPIDGNVWGGWGYSVNSISQPGPTINVTQGELVTMNLTSADNATHRFFVDYNGNHMPDTGEPDSGNFGPFNVSVIFQFTPNQSGVFNYYCAHHPDIMFGEMSINASVPEFQVISVVIVLLVLVSIVGIASKKCGIKVSK